MPRGALSKIKGIYSTKLNEHNHQVQRGGYKCVYTL